MVWNSWCFRGWKKSHSQSVLKKWMSARLIHFFGFLLLLVNKRITLERACQRCNRNWEKEKECLKTTYLLKIRVLESSPKKRGTKFKRGRSFTLVTWFSWPMVSWDWIFVCVHHLCYENKWHTVQIKLYECKVPYNRVVKSLEELCIRRVATSNSFVRLLNPTHIYIYIYIYIYI